MEQIEITCEDNGKTKVSEVLTKTDKYLKVAVEGTQLTIEMFREDVNKPYIGHKSGLKFTWQLKN
jgi:hypothetical protein